MKVGSLFSGIGGIEIGFETQGIETTWFIENNPYAKAILRKRFPYAKIYDDAKEIDFRTVPKVDIISFGFPCQDISNAGKRAGIEGSRSSLWKYGYKAIVQIRPKITFIENVSALTRRGFDTVLCDLAKIGYDAEWHCVSASSVGAYHRRDRIFIIATDSQRTNTNRFGLDRQKEQQQRKTEFQDKQERGTEGLCKDVSNTKSIRQSGGKMSTDPRHKSENQQSRNKGRSETVKHIRIWSVEPKLGRVADGISNRMDRIKCLGNAVVPQVAEVFAKAIKEVYQS
ncbi:MAG TPA: DNA cytosine methyltransferase [bacterium]|nr:DNA cytosine methyltransferase [bacterium]